MTDAGPACRRCECEAGDCAAWRTDPPPACPVGGKESNHPMTLRPPARPVSKRRQYADMAEGTGAGVPRHQQTVDRPAGVSGPLSARQMEVLRWMAEGFTNEQIAERLVMKPATVATHITQVIKRLGAKNAKNAITVAFRRRLIQ